MKSTGIIRRVDELGRVVIPMEIRNQFNIVEKDPIEIYVEGSCIVLKKYEPNCIFCGNTKNLVEYKDKLVCDKCTSLLNSLQEDSKNK
ncbi:MAG: AbrB/MazE/SpoVT family DNA-binding domain-containing protein [Clostridia bacterium]|jgi:transcriptional pleiotropic regulator of transition state genes|nr:AbrB/MazE/SpoVT family DNA-binding domain-containing protein [bacterium]